eukprot:7150448-Lingulodinium_polyedra.AAC.1
MDKSWAGPGCWTSCRQRRATSRIAPSSGASCCAAASTTIPRQKTTQTPPTRMACHGRRSPA